MEILVDLTTIMSLPIMLDISKPYKIFVEKNVMLGVDCTVIQGTFKNPFIIKLERCGYYLSGSIEENEKLIETARFNHQFQGFLES